MAEVTARRRLGRTAVEVTELGFGGASIGELFVRVSEDDAARDRSAAAWDGGVRYFDTAPWYGRGLSELRTGAGLRDHPRGEFALSTKVGRWLRPADREGFDGAPWLGGSPNEVVFDYTYDGIMRSVEQSRLRLGITRFDIAVIHDLDRLYFDAADDRGPLPRPGRVRLAGARRAALQRPDRRDRGRDQRPGADPALPGHRGHRRVPGRDALHAARPGRARRRVPGLRRARGGVRHRGGRSRRGSWPRVRSREPGTPTPTPRPRSWRRLAGSPRSATATACRWRRRRCSSRSGTRPSRR